MCGKRKERRVCCASEQPQEQQAVQTSAVAPKQPKKIGTFTNIFHDIAGTAYALNNTTILIKGFNYDGEGPDAFFLGGKHGRPSKSGEVNSNVFLTLLIFWIFSLQGSDALPIWGEALQLQGQDHPHTWKVIVYTSTASTKRINILLICNSRFNGKKDVVLHLPPGSTVDQLKYEIQYLSNWFQSSKSSTYLRILIVWTLTLYFFQMDLCLVSRLHSQLWPCECAIKLFYLVSRTCC